MPEADSLPVVNPPACLQDSFEQMLTDKQVLMWPADQGLLEPRPTPTLTGSVLNLLAAANKAEVEAQLQATAVKVNQLVALVNRLAAQ